jgi:hypothetical protein
VPIEFSPDSLHDALIEERLYPDQFLAYFSRCLLPGVAAVGGAVQQDYMQVFRHILLNSHARYPFFTEEFQIVAGNEHSLLGGAAIIEPSEELKQFLRDLGPHVSFDQMFDSLGSLSLGECMGSLEHLAYWDGIVARYRGRWGKADRADEGTVVGISDP